MGRYHSYLNTAKKILQQYKGEEPFSSFIKKFFSAEKKYGSKDRKQITHLCYCFLRLRPGKEKNVKQKLRRASISFKEINPSCLALHNGAKIEEEIELNKEAVVQDLNSQNIAKFFPVRPGRSDLPTGQAGRVWDC